MLDFNELEKKILSQWDENDAFKKQLEVSKDKKKYVFFDGPPFATGLPHYGHILAGTIKDTIPRFFSMNGFFVDRIFGFDCHGLPVEHEIDKLHSLDREKILKIGIKEYNRMCKSIVTRYATEWKAAVNRLGRWVDFDRGYKTMDFEFMQKTWEIFGELYNKELVYKGYRVMPFSTGCETPLSNFEANQNYKEVEDLSIYFSVNLRKCRDCLNNLKIKTINCKGNCKILDKYPNLRAAVWTTTPWTLPANLALGINITFQYFIIKRTDEEDENFYLVLSNKAGEIFPGFIIQTSISGKSLIGIEYKPIFDYLIKENDIFNVSNCFVILDGKFVTSDTGTGIVHLAPGFGMDDHQCFVENKLIESNAHVPCPVDDSGLYTKTVYDLTGVYVKEADTLIICKLKNHIIKSESYAHRYPFCWRSDTPLLYKIVPNWFVRVKNSRKKLVENNSKIKWSPKNVGVGRFENWIANAEDWSISRNRFWGTPIPIFQSTNLDNNKYICISNYEKILENMITGCNCCKGFKFSDLKKVNVIFYDYDVINESPNISIFENSKYKSLNTSLLESLKQLNKIIDLQSQCKKLIEKDIHREFIDYIQIYNKGENYRRITEVLDCWFESGSMPYGTSCNRYSYSNTIKKKEILNQNCIPADFIGEGLDQTRGWFYTLHVISTLLYDKPAYSNVLVNGIVLAEDGKKMSKRLKNYPDPLNIIEKYGADSLRMYLLSSPVVEAENLRFSENGVKDIGKRLLSWWNCLNIVKEIIEADNFKFIKCLCDDNDKSKNKLSDLLILNTIKINIPKEEFPHFCNIDDLDIFILQSLSNFSQNISSSFLKYKLSNLLNDLDKFLDDLSNWYIRIKREKIRNGNINVLLFVLENLSRICAPFAIFFSEITFQEIQRLKNIINGIKDKEYESVHWTNFPYFDIINFDFEKTKNVIEAIRSARASNKLPIKRPLKEVYLVDTNLSELCLETIKLECNILSIKSLDKKFLEYDVTVKPNFMTIKQNKDLISGVNQLFGRSIKPKKKLIKKFNDSKQNIISSNSLESLKQVNEIIKIKLINSSNDLEKKFENLSINERNYNLLKYLQNGNLIETNLGEIKLEHTIHELSLKSFKNELKPNYYEKINLSPSQNSEWFSYSSNNYDLIINKKLNTDILHLMSKREFKSAVQKLRKKCLLKPSDDVKLIVDFLSTENKYNLTKRELYAVLSSDMKINKENEVSGDELISEEVKIAEFEIRIRLFK